jgi:beta-lactamase class A
VSAPTRRGFIASAGAVMLAGCAPTREDILNCELLEQKAGGRLGVFVLDTGTGRAMRHRANEPFGMCSTFKLPLAGVVLVEAQAGRLSLEEQIAFTQADMVFHAPVTSQYLAQGSMTIEALAQAAQKTSDNVAANLLVRRLGGPASFTAKVHALYPHGFRLDRYEPDINFVPAGEVRDTATPEGMGGILVKLLAPKPNETPALSPAGRATLFQWMADTTTGAKRIRAGLPADWKAGDKTGTALADGMVNKTHDVAIAWAPGKADPIVIVAFYESPGACDNVRDEDQAVLAEVGRLATAWVQAQG